MSEKINDFNIDFFDTAQNVAELKLARLVARALGLSGITIKQIMIGEINITNVYSDNQTEPVLTIEPIEILFFKVSRAEGFLESFPDQIKDIILNQEIRKKGNNPVTLKPHDPVPDYHTAEVIYRKNKSSWHH